MTVQEKVKYIHCILSQLRLMAYTQKKVFDYGSTSLSLIFKEDKELIHIAKLCGIK